MPREETRREPAEKEKVIMGYKVKFKTEYDNVDANGEFLNLKVQISNDLKEVLRKCVITTGEVPTKIGISYNDTGKTVDSVRYKIKSLISNSLESSAKDLIFAKVLIDTGELSLNLLDTDRALYTIEKIKTGIRKILEVTIGISNLSQEVIFNVID